MTEIVKICSKHGDLTIEFAYYKKSNEKYYCRHCMRANEKRRPKRKYEGAHADYHREYARKWRQQHADLVNERMKQDRINNPDKYRKYEANYIEKHGIDKVRKEDVARKHELTLEEYEHLIASQNNLCEICKKAETRRGKNGKDVAQLVVDHCHYCEAWASKHVVRGLICHGCNILLARSKDNVEILRNHPFTKTQPERMKSMILYVERHKHVQGEQS